MSLKNTTLDDELDKVPNKRHSTLASLIAGSFGGASQVIVGQPFDTIKTRAQVAPSGTFKGPWDIVQQTLKKEGPLAFYKGMVSPLIGASFVNSLLFAANSQARRLINPRPEHLTIGQVALAGSIAGSVQAILASPVEMFKIRMQAQYGAGKEVKKLREVVSEMYTNYGWKQGIMRGYWVTVWREIPAYAGFYGAYEYSKRAFQKQYGEEIPFWATLTAGALGGVAYWTACYPLDVVKSRIQIQELPPSRGYILSTLNKMYKEEGAKAFVRGLSPTYIRAVPSAASTFLAFELAMSVLEKHTNI